MKQTIRRALAGVLASGLLLLGTGSAVAQEMPPAEADDLTLIQAEVIDPNLIQMVNNLFGPSEITVPVGTTLTWVNLDAEAHDVVSSDFTTFMSPIVNTGEQWSLTFEAPGTYAYLCDLHADMEGVVIVE